jgi:hypothetical protein
VGEPTRVAFGERPSPHNPRRQRPAIEDLNNDWLKDFVPVAPRPDVPAALELAS